MPYFLIQILVTLIIVGLLLWVVQQIPMDPKIAQIVRVVVIVCVAVWLIYILMGMFPAGSPVYAPRR